MTKKSISSNLINSTKKTEWDFGNKVLYDLCRNNFSHKEDEKILAKIWLIGRSYAAAVERRDPKFNKEKYKGNDFFYLKKVVPKFKKSKIDEELQRLKKIKELSPKNFEEVLKLHHYLVNELRKITGLNKRSLCSKYLHFHLPNLFFLFDTRAKSTVNKYIYRLSGEMDKFVSLKKVDKEYARFFCKSYMLREQIKREHNIVLSPRHIDNLLLELFKTR